MVRYLLDNQLCLASAVRIGPDSVEQLAENGIEGLDVSYAVLLVMKTSTHLLLTAHLLITGGVLSLEGSDEPPEDALHTVLRGGALRDLSEKTGVFTPVRGKLRERDGRENDYASAEH